MKYDIARITQTMLQAQIAAADIVREILEDDPAMTTDELVRRLEVLRVEAEEEYREKFRMEYAECRYCGQDISRPATGDVDMWRHLDDARSRGCRAASFDYDAERAWDNTLKRTWMAKPKR